VTVDTFDERYVAQKVASAVSTYAGELPLMPQFGTRDPEFNEFDSGGVVYTCAIFFPEVDITSIYDEIDNNGKLAVNVEFQVRSEGSNYGIS
jgi:hypothetical protein